jgi:hypothetical protein
MITLDEFVCPLCGVILSSLTQYHRHYDREHTSDRAPAERRMTVHPDDAALTQQVLSGTWNGEQG